MGREWSWSTADAEWSVAFEPKTGVLRWVGVDNPRPGVPAYAQGGGSVEQPALELLTTGRPRYTCPPDILVRVLVAARAALPLGDVTVATLPPAPHTMDGILRACQAVARKLTGANAPLSESRRLLLEEEIPDDRPTQTSGWRSFFEVRLGDAALFLCRIEAGGWLRGDSAWFTADFAGLGRLELSFDEHRTEITSNPKLIEAFSNALAMDLGPEVDDRVVHERAEKVVRRRFAGQPDFIWEVTTELCREGLLVRGRASRAALDLYCALIPNERFFIMHLRDASD